MTGSALVSISVVSHGQGDLVGRVLADLARFSGVARIEVILTRNIPEQLPFLVTDFPFPVKEVENASPKGFGANHNAAFQLAEGTWFCVINPDIRLDGNPFPALLTCLDNPDVGVAAPLVLGVQGEIEDSARRFPSPLKILCKVVGREAKAVKTALARQGILVRYFNKPGLQDHIRISVGKPEHTDRLLAALHQLEGETS